MSVAVYVPRSERGQTLIEFAFVGPIIIVFLMLIVDFGIALDHRQMLQSSVREGARYGAVGHNTASIIKYTLNDSGAPTGTAVSVCYVDIDGNGNPGDAGDNVRVSGEYTHELTVNVLLGDATEIVMEPSAQARLEKAVTGPGVDECP